MPLPTFERQMRWLAANYELVGLEQWVARLSQGASLRGVVAVTFDDGYKGVFDLAWPLLRDLGIPATVFVVGRSRSEEPTSEPQPRPHLARPPPPATKNTRRLREHRHRRPH